MQSLPPLPDPLHVKRSQARDIAEGMSRLFASSGITQVWLYVAPNGDVMYEVGKPLNPTDGVGELSLVGVYTAQASQRQIEDDILAMERERIA